MGSVQFSMQTAIISTDSINQLTFVIVKLAVLFEVRIDFLYYLDDIRLQRCTHIIDKATAHMLGKA
jgi:hypothetical protein